MSEVFKSAPDQGVDRGSDSATGSTGAQRAPLAFDDLQAQLGAFNLKGALNTLLERAGDNLTLPELLWLADGSRGAANSMAIDAAQVSEGLLCLVADDGATGVGSFREPDDVAALLSHFGHVFQTITGLLELGAGAQNRAAWRGRQ